MDPSVPDEARVPGLSDAYDLLEQLDVEVISHHFQKQTALARSDGLLAIDYRKLHTQAEELEVLLHEIGHFTAGAFYTPADGAVQRARAEVRAQRWVFERYYPPLLLARLMQKGDQEPWQLAERLGLPERFVREMLTFYTEARCISFDALCEEDAEHAGPPAVSAGAAAAASAAGGRAKARLPAPELPFSLEEAEARGAEPSAQEPPGKDSEAPPRWVQRQGTSGRPIHLLVQPGATRADIEAAVAEVERLLRTPKDGGT